jgi:hypothetical protein
MIILAKRFIPIQMMVIFIVVLLSVSTTHAARNKCGGWDPLFKALENVIWNNITVDQNRNHYCKRLRIDQQKKLYSAKWSLKTIKDLEYFIVKFNHKAEMIERSKRPPVIPDEILKLYPEAAEKLKKMQNPSNSDYISKLISVESAELLIAETNVLILKLKEKVEKQAALPKDPGEADKATLEGIDSDNDGVRDDIQRFIAFNFIQKDKLQDFLTLYAKTYQQTLLNAKDKIKSRQNYKTLHSLLKCRIFMEFRYGGHYIIPITKLIKKLINTDLRKLADKQYKLHLTIVDLDLKGNVFDQKEFCHSDLVDHNEVSHPIEVKIELPDDPGKAGKATLEGIDSDNDGVRDDLQRFIALTHTHSAKFRAYLTQEVKSMQRSLIVADSKILSVELAHKGSLDSECGSYIDSVTVHSYQWGNQSPVLELLTEVLNTKERSLAYIRYNSKLGGEIYGSGEPARYEKTHLKKYCEFDPDVLPN